MNDQPLYLDATMLYRWRTLAPVGIVRLERLLAAHLRLRSRVARAEYVVWDNGYRPADTSETEILDRLLAEGISRQPVDENLSSNSVGTPIEVIPRRGLRARVRRQGMRVIARFPDHLRPFAEQAAWSMATLAVESARHLRRATARSRRIEPSRSVRDVRHRVDFSSGGDLVALGLGWEYIDHEEMYRLKTAYDVRIHMPAFDLIPVTMPQMNAGQSDLVHRYYAEMAHYADSITSISYSTTDALRRFYEEESLPIPAVATNQPPSFSLGESRPDDGHRSIRHRLHGEPFVLSVSTVEIRKNHVLLAKVWTDCARQGVELPKLAIVGKIGWDVTEFFRWIQHAPEIRDRVTVYADVDDDELEGMYRDCLFTVFPSRIEGWGMPIAESMAYGKVCLHTTDASQVEASQGLMPSLHPDDFVGWKREIQRLAGDSTYRTDLEAIVRDQYVPRTIEQYCATYEQILVGRREGAPT